MRRLEDEEIRRLEGVDFKVKVKVIVIVKVLTFN